VVLADGVVENARDGLAGFKAAIDGFFANLAEYSAEIRSLITDSFHYIGKQDPQAP
jgi:hypothetical protein